MKYTAINIGPIIQTFTLARKPREFWAASYLFSYLMQRILEKLDAPAHKQKATLISPCFKEEILDKRVGLFPDRAFYRVEQELDIAALVEQEVVPAFARSVRIPRDVVERYFRRMVASAEYASDHEAIAGLNRILDGMELYELAVAPGDGECIRQYLRHTTNDHPSPLFPLAFGTKRYPIETLEELASGGSAEVAYSHQRYICIVQADGDNMGSVVKSAETEGKLAALSETLMSFGVAACRKITDYGGLPIYAGGDDLLFIAPVWGGRMNIFDLLREIDLSYGEVAAYVGGLKIRKDQDVLQTSLSYGLSITYCKYPLYEAWKNAREQLFDVAKKHPGKNAIAWKLQKHSGSDFQGVMNKDSRMFGKFDELVYCNQTETWVSAVSHKFRSNEMLLGLFPKKAPFDGLESRLDAFYRKIIDEEASTGNEPYFPLTKALFLAIYQEVFSREPPGVAAPAPGAVPEPVAAPAPAADTEKEKKKIKEVVATFYNALRTAKFIQGEEVKA